MGKDYTAILQALKQTSSSEVQIADPATDHLVALARLALHNNRWLRQAQPPVIV